MFNLTTIVFAFIIFCSLTSFGQENDYTEKIIESISAQKIKHNMEFLASDLFEGRAPGTVGGNLAAKYIAVEFSSIGLKPTGHDNTFYQYVPMHSSYPLASSELKLYLDSTEMNLHLNQDYLMYKTGQQTFTPVPLALVFVGYGIIAPEFDYNDYQSVDVESKIVVFLDGEPYSAQPDYFDGGEATIYSYSSSKQRIAVSRGAAGSILIPTDKNLNWNDLKKEFGFEDVSLAYSVSSNLSILINPELADTLFNPADYSFEDVLIMKRKGNMKSFPLKTKISFEGRFEQRDFVSPNVIGIIEGSDPELKDSYVIISAHYDHLGIGPPVEGDSIYNGALDNAIGVSALIELAGTFSSLDRKPRRSLLFIALTGEEKGLLGSSYYTDHPVVPLYKTVANLNIDGIAMFEDFSSVVGIGSGYSTLGTFLNESASKFDIDIQDIPPQFKSNEEFNRSDQMAFALAGIPSILILEGLNNKYKKKEEVLETFINYLVNIYHTPFDDLNQKINYDAAVRHVKLLFDFIYRVANSKEAPEWKKDAPFVNARLRSIAERK